MILDEGRNQQEVTMDFIRELISLISVFASYVESPGNGPEKKEKVKQMIKDALPHEQWKIDPEFFDFILDVLIDVVVMFLKKGFWKSAMKVSAK
jgi:maltooligosyltrehalose synthase